MKNKMKNNEKLARNTIRVRDSIKKRSNEKTTQTKSKRWQTRLFALVGCLLLVSALVVPCFADYSNGSFEPIVGTIDGFSADVLGVGNVNFDGFTRLNFAQINHIPYEPSQNTTVLATFDTGDCFFYTASSNTFRPCIQLELYNSAGNVILIPTVISNGNQVEYDFNSGDYLYVRNYPFNITDGTASAWEALQFDAYAVSSSGTDNPDNPDVPDVPDVPDNPDTPDNPNVPDEPVDTGSVMGVWSYIMRWITTALGSVQSVFYVNGELTFLGVLAVVGVSIAIGWLIIGVVTRFFQLRG